MLKERYLKSYIKEDLKDKMVFLAGPRQVGKTTLAKQILDVVKTSTEYLLWDNRDDRKVILNAEWPSEKTTVVLDELHKFRKWKGWLKGEYDKHRDHLRIIVTGSARMDIFRRGGDSLQGRYHNYRLHPFSLNELSNRIGRCEPFKELKFSPDTSKDNLEQLFRFSGFPEPLIAASSRTHRRWQKERLDRFFREDVRDLENVRDLSMIQILADMLPEKASSMLSLNSLREDLEVSHKAVKHWIDILERLYFVFRLKPFTAKAIRGLKKETKLYMWDWTLVAEEGNKFENMIASHLLKYCHFLEDTEGYRCELFYLRDVDKREVDFLVTVNRQPWFAVEAKLKETDVAHSLKFFGERLKIPYLYQVVKDSGRDFTKDNVRVIPAEKFLSAFV